MSSGLCGSFRVFPKRAFLGPDDELLNMRVIPTYTGRPNMLPVLACGAKWFPPHPAPCQVIREHYLRTSYAKLFIYISSLKPRYISEIATMFPMLKMRKLKLREVKLAAPNSIANEGCETSYCLQHPTGGFCLRSRSPCGLHRLLSDRKCCQQGSKKQAFSVG